MLKSKQFGIALILANTTAKAWAKDHGVTRQAVWFVLNGRSNSTRLSSAIERFIRQELQKLPALSTLSEEVTKAA